MENYQLTKKGKPFVCTSVCEQNFRELKERLVTTPVLTVPDGLENLVVYNDASRKGKVITYASRKLKEY